MPNNKNQKKKPINPLLPVSIIVVAVAVLLVGTDFTSRFKKDTNTTITKESSNTASSDAIQTNENGDVEIKAEDITDQAAFYEYDYNGTTVGLFAVKASDGTIRTALNTCQVCNGSPYAFFNQQENQFQCQNCGNLFSLDMIGQERGGCNPIPITSEDRADSDNGSIVIPASFLGDNAALFNNWKKY